MTLKRMALIGIPAIVLTLGVSGAASAASLVTNGSFELSNNGIGQLGFNTTVTDWSVPAPSGSYTFLFNLPSADTTGSTGQYGSVSLWGPGNGSSNGLTASPDGGNFIGQDSDFQDGALTQTINGLTSGQVYAVSFDWAAAQQYGFSGTTYSGWKVNLGTNAATAQSTSEVTIPSHGFNGWNTTTFDFTATGTSEVLSFLAIGGPSGTIPPFALLDGVAMNAVPEPTAVSMLVVGLLGLGAFRLRRRA